MSKNYQLGISTIAIILIIILILLAGGLIWYFGFKKETVNQKINLNYAPVSNKNSEANTNTNNDWLVFTNNNYNFSFSYPTDWYYIPDAMSGPPPPVTTFFASTAQTAGNDYSSFFIYATDLMGESLDTWSEIQLLEDDGYIKSDITVDGEAAVRLERNTHPSDTGATIYVAKGDYMYRIIWGSTTQVLDQANSAIQEQMADSFKFIDPLVPDFNQSGNMIAPTDTVYWRLLWETPGNPAISKELVFNEMNYTSMCTSGTSKTNCENALANEIIIAGDLVNVKGIINPENENQVFVLTITTATSDDSNENTNSAEDCWREYGHVDAHFSVGYPCDWEVKSSEFYETADGEKAKVPTVTLGRINDTDETTNNNRIFINFRQSGCMAVEPYDMTEETVNDIKISFYTLYKSDEQTVDTWCAETEVNGYNIDYNDTTYHFVSYYNDSSIKDIFKNVVKSFKTTPKS